MEADSKLTRYALFEARVRPDMDSEMHVYVNDVLATLWRKFDGAHTVRVMFGLEQTRMASAFCSHWPSPILMRQRWRAVWPAPHAMSHAIYCPIFLPNILTEKYYNM